MDRVAKLNPRVVDLRGTLEEFLLFKQAGGAAARTLEDYACHVNAFLKSYPKLADYEALRKAVLEHLATFA